MNKSKTKPKEQTSTIARPCITVAKVRIRDVSSSNSSYSSSKSRDPSPCEPARDRYTPSSGYVSSSYSKLYPRSSNKLLGNNLASQSTGPAVSYLNGSDVGGQYRRNIEQNENNTKISKKENSPTEKALTIDTIESSELIPEQHVEMMAVNVVTRGTSPNLCSTSTTNFSRCKRAEIAKTIEKTIMRPKRKVICEDKEIQSDRMDDSTKKSRFSSTRASTPWPLYMENKYTGLNGYTRYNVSSSVASLSRYNNAAKCEKNSSDCSPEKSLEKSSEKSLEKNSENSIEKLPEKSPSKSSRESFISKSPSISRSNSKSEKSKSKSPPVPIPKSTSSSPTKQRMCGSRALPPQSPKSESLSPAKVISASSSTSSANTTTSSSKWANKDFRKSALNVGQTDRPRKVRTSSASTDNDDIRKLQQKSATIQRSISRSDRSSSVSSETSYSSSGNAEEVTKNFMKIKISPPPTTTTTTLAKLNDAVHLNSDVMTCEAGHKPVEEVQTQEKESPHTNDSFAKSNNATSSIVNRMLSPITKIFKTKSQHFGDSPSCSEHNIPIRANDSIKQGTLVESVLNQMTTTSNETKLVSSNNYLADESSWINSTLNEQTTHTQFDKFQSGKTTNMKNQLKGQTPWWLNEAENDDTVAEDVTLNQIDPGMTQINSIDGNKSNQTNSSIPWWMSDEAISLRDMGQEYRITHIRSGERAWWLDEDTEDSVIDILEAAETENVNGSKFTFKIKKMDSGERAWWLCENNENMTPIESTNHNVCDISNEDDTEDIDFWATINESLEAKRKESNEKKLRNQRKRTNNYQYDINANYIPLGDRASPEGLEDFKNRVENRLSPFDNINGKAVEACFGKLFISRHQNIDDVLGASCHALSPIRLCNDTDLFAEILPSQVLIHNGTPDKITIESERYVKSNRTTIHNFSICFNLTNFSPIIL